MPPDRLRFALEAAGVGLWDWDIPSGDLWWSDNLEQIHGLPPNAFDGNFATFRRFIHPDDLGLFDLAVRDALDGGTDFLVEFRVPGADGRTRWIRGQGRVFRGADGKPTRLIGVGLDVTARREEERATRQMGEIASASADAIVSVTMDGLVTAWNDGAARLYGYSAEEMLGASIARIVPETRRSELADIFDRLRRGQRITEFETERLAKDGRRVAVSISSGPVIDRFGRVVEAATIARDVTKRRRESERQRLIADVGAALTSSIDAKAALTGAASVLVREFADRCTVHLVTDGGLVERPVELHRDPQRGAGAQARQASVLADATGAMGVSTVLQTGLPELYPVVTPSMIAPSAGRKDGADALAADGVTSAVVVPLVARGQTIGALALYSIHGRRTFDAEDLAVASELGLRMGLAVENARLFERVAAAEKQLRLVADHLPALVSYVDADRRYRFINRRYEDWFGRPRETLLGTPAGELPGDAAVPAVVERINQALAGREVSYELEQEYPKLGRRNVEVSYVPDVDDAGNVRGMVALVVDVTDRRVEQRRAVGLNRLTAALARAVTERDVADCIIAHGLDAIGATAGGVAAVEPGGAQLCLLSVRGLPQTVAPGHCFSVDAETSFGTVFRARAPLLLSNWSERTGRLAFHAKLAMPNAMGALATLPLMVEDRMLGSFAAIFAEDRVFLPGDLDFMMTVASLCAQSLERARLFDSERRARAEAEVERTRLAFLAEVSRELAGSLDVPSELQRIGRLVVPALADWCSVDLLDDDGALERVTVLHADPERQGCAERLLHEFGRLRPNRDHTMWKVLTEGQTWFDAAVDPARLETEARSPDHLRVLECLGYAGELVIPLLARGRALGALTLVRGAERERFTPSEQSLAEDLAGRVALAIDNARLFRASQSSEQRYRALYEGVGDALLVVDGAGCLRGGNAAAIALLGYGADELDRMHVGDLIATEPGGDPALARCDPSGEAEVRRKDGTTFVADVSVSQVELPSGPASLVDLQDITAKKTLERLQRDYLAMVTHDLRSPLAAIRVQAQLMQRRGAYSEDGTSAIVGQTERMSRLIDALADVVRMDAGRFDLHYSAFDLVELARECVGQEVAQLPEREVIVEAGGPVLGIWDRDRVAQVIANLIGNALKYGDPTYPIVVRIEDGDEPAVLVADRGPGIAEEHLPKLFERFYRADVTGAGGLGLGLFIARMLSEAHGGRITVTSTPGQGSTFRAVLPRGRSVA